MAVVTLHSFETFLNHRWEANSVGRVESSRSHDELTLRISSDEDSADYRDVFGLGSENFGSLTFAPVMRYKVWWKGYLFHRVWSAGGLVRRSDLNHRALYASKRPPPPVLTLTVYSWFSYSFGQGPSILLCFIICCQYFTFLWPHSNFALHEIQLIDSSERFLITVAGCRRIGGKTWALIMDKTKYIKPARKIKYERNYFENIWGMPASAIPRKLFDCHPKISTQRERERERERDSKVSQQVSLIPVFEFHFHAFIRVDLINLRLVKRVGKLSSFLLCSFLRLHLTLILRFRFFSSETTEAE
jgi:hypothetical protein